MNGDTAFFREYALNLTAACYPGLTARRREHRTTDMEILMLGDSHGWGQGSAGYDVVLPAYSAHMAVPYSNGFYARLRKRIIAKYGLYPAEAPNREWFHHSDVLRKISGSYTAGKEAIAGEPEASGFFAPKGCKDNADLATLGYLALDQKFSEDLLALGTDARCELDMAEHASKVYIGVRRGVDGARLEVFFQQRDGKGNTAGLLYRQPDGYPRVTRVVRGRHIPVGDEEAIVAGSENVVIDTYKPGEEEETVYCIDYGQKQRGRLVFCHAGSRSEANGGVVRLRGIVFDGNAVRNFSMGGHTTGQWLGDGTSSYNDGPQPHMEQLLRYVPFTPTLVVIQAPIVNEYLRQTPIDTFERNLGEIMRICSLHLNGDGASRTDLLLLTTPGDKRIAYEGAPEAAIRYEDYYEAVRRLARSEGVGLLDFERFFRDQVRTGALDYEFLFDDPIHPGPYANEFIAKILGQTIDLIM